MTPGAGARTIREQIDRIAHIIQTLSWRGSGESRRWSSFGPSRETLAFLAEKLRIHGATATVETSEP
jgi:hypothetical protein